MNDSTPVFYVPGKPGIIDLAILHNGLQVGQYSGETIDQMAIRHPGVALGELGPVCEQSENYFRHAPVKITRERFFEMLEVLPPVGWIHEGNAESFKLSERTSGNITAIFAAVAGQYFEMSDSIFMSHAKIVEACKAAA